MRRGGVMIYHPVKDGQMRRWEASCMVIKLKVDRGLKRRSLAVIYRRQMVNYLICKMFVTRL
jgi:hypothetical protein